MSSFDININFGVFGLWTTMLGVAKRVFVCVNVLTNLFITFVKEHNHERVVVVNV
jgi:hypothetical protein